MNVSSAHVAYARRTVAVFLLTAAIIVPFLIWGERLDALVPRLVADNTAQPLLGAIVALLLAADIVLPIPSSIVAFLSGQLLGFVPGALANFAGFTIGCLAGYAIGRFGGRPLAVAICGESDVMKLEQGFARWGKFSVLLMRGVPVLAEASIILAGVTRLGFARSMGLAAVPNVCLSVLFAWAGAARWDTLSGLGVFLFSVGMPMVVYYVTSKCVPVV